MSNDTEVAMVLVRRFNVLMDEHEQAVEAAGGCANLDPAWREGWMARKAALVKDVEAYGRQQGYIT
jgi:hypothetical protein